MPHIHEHYDFTVAAFIVFKDRVLLVNHPRYGKWIPPGGHIELDEDPEEALFREIEEETGLSVRILASRPNVASPGTKFILQPNFIDVHEANPPHRHIGLTYFGIASTDKVLLSDEHSGYKWFSVKNLHESQFELSPAIVFYSEQALAAAKKHLKISPASL